MSKLKLVDTTNHSNHLYFGLFILLLNLGLGFYFAHLDPFLHTWDEQFHALVAKNLSKNPLLPMLYSSQLANDGVMNWAGSTIWLHKQPFFLWIMALSIKLFGSTIFAVRFPSVVLHALLSLVIYRSGALALNRTVGLLAAIIFTFSRYPLELVSGFYRTDHNDLVMMFLVSVTFWAWIEYQFNRSWKWLLIIALFSAFAVLTKWLVGLLVFGAWFVAIIVDRDWKQAKPLFGSMIVSICLFLPWQLYTFIQFPEFAKHEFALNSAHLFEVVEGHGGEWFYHISGLKAIYGLGDAVPYIVLLGFGLLLWKTRSTPKLAWFFGSACFVVYLIFSLAATKMTSFPLVVSLPIYLGMAALFDAAFTYVLRFIKNPKWRQLGVTALVTFIVVVWLDLPRVHSDRALNNPTYGPNRAAMIGSLERAQQIKLPLEDSAYVLYNVNSADFEHIAIMYYRDFNAVFYHLPTDSELRKAAELGLIPVCIQAAQSKLSCPEDERILELEI